MFAHRLLSLMVVIFMSIALSGCYVYALAPPASSGPTIDPRLEGAWYGLDEKRKPAANAFLHFITPKAGGPMRMVSTQTGDYGVFELHTMKIGRNQVFAIRKFDGPVAGGAKVADSTAKYMLGAYEIRGDTLMVRVYQPESLRAAVASRTVSGVIEGTNFPSVTLNGSPQDVARFLATPQADAALGEPYPLARRLRRPR